ncbi:MAG: membrane protein insertase YidC, partial [Gammaproteobacteria bacterium]|nr:membrane protein insertase YidC [Gammaproteobacteria bacterium]
MDNQRFLLWASFGLVLFLIYQAWMEDYYVRPSESARAPTAEGAPAEQGATGDADEGEGLLPSITAAPGSAALEPPGAAPVETGGGTEKIRVVTDVLRLEIDPAGGALVRAAIPRYPVEKKRPNDPVVLLDTRDEFFVVQTGLRAAGGADEPNHRAQWEPEANAYRLEEGDDALTVRMRWQGGDVSAVREYRFKRGSYQVDIDTRVSNAGTAPWAGADYMQIIRDNRVIERSFTSVESYSYRGPAVYDGERYEKLDAGDLEDGAWRVSAAGGWLALIQHHFLVAAVPPPDVTYQLEAALLSSNRYLLRTVGPTRSVAPG